MGQPVVHFEIVGRDGKALRSFYSDLFGWDAVGLPANPDYAMVEREGNTNPEGIGIGGAISSLPEQPSSTWQGPIRADGYEGHVTVYVEVPDVDAALGQAESLGGKRMLGPDEIPGGPTIGAFTDPEGHLIGIVGSQP
ncbi:MAG: VOC family protein [Solirubrobacterales bacterium]|nr:VOC family protein [Solirubrobacterales bacterium]